MKTIGNITVKELKSFFDKAKPFIKDIDVSKWKKADYYEFYENRYYNSSYMSKDVEVIPEKKEVKIVSNTPSSRRLRRNKMRR